MSEFRSYFTNSGVAPYKLDDLISQCNNFEPRGSNEVNLKGFLQVLNVLMPDPEDSIVTLNGSSILNETDKQADDCACQAACVLL